MTIDCEDWFHGLEIGIESWHKYERRIEGSVNKLLELFKNSDTKATFFILGNLAEEFPELVKRIADAGHEIGSHGYSHQFVYKLSPEEFRNEMLRTNEILYKITGQPVVSFRAPYFSITRQSLWALDILHEVGIVYDSSIFPVINYRYGIPEAFRMPHWIMTPKGSKIFEFPASTIKIGGKNVPVGGGAYFRIFPYAFTKMGLKHLNRSRRPGMFYLHPWELDPKQPKIDLPFRIKLTHYWNLHRTEQKFKKLLNDFKFIPFKDVINYEERSKEIKLLPHHFHKQEEQSILKSV